MLRSDILCFDFETSSKFSSKAQILQIGAVVIERNSLEIIDRFESLLKPIDFTTVEAGALAVNHLTVEQLEQAPETTVVWELFTNWINKYNKSKGNFSTWDSVIGAGFNTLGYDMPILRRYCQMYGPWDKNREDQKLLHPVYHYDVLQQMAFWTENMPEVTKLNLSSVLSWMGVEETTLNEAHAADFDADASAQILIKLLKMARFMVKKDSVTGKRKLEMKNCLAGWRPEK